ncbi:amidohydrolase family protein [Nocardia amamiensis]|uniref:Amidohydrolase family protein n=1 Tax=Nocardia amamiensis TaxID=404578 RepID=A0ABS0CS64_9NOCA|nr:amidohydrolase family protein [Nocardia amamiensis]MBF6299454.1 amidohydrolase family protein [Nocardia amamiensis]
MTAQINRIVDAHVHWWDVEANPWYEYIRNVGEMTGTNLHSNYLPADYRRSIGDVGVSKVIHVSAVVGTQHYVDELRWVDSVAAGSGFEVGCVGSVDPVLDSVELRAHLDAQFDTGRLRGIRVLEGLDPDGDAACTLADWLIQRDLVLDLVARPDTLERWTRFIADRPRLRVVLEHSGWPLGADDASYQAWEQSLTRFASNTDAAVKVSGLAMVTFEVSEARMRPWIECCVDRFGWDRVVFASNFPVDGLAGSYGDLIRVFDEVLRPDDEVQLEKFFAANAERIYRL